MKLLFVNHLLDPVSGGGTAERTFQLARFRALAGDDCTILTLDIGLSAAPSVPGLRVHALPSLNNRFFLPFAKPGEIRRLVRAADVVYLSGHWTVLNALVYRACRRLRKPFIFCPAGALKPFGRSLRIKRLYDWFAGRAIVLGAERCVAITEDESADFVARGLPSACVALIPNGIDPEHYRLDNFEEAVADFRRIHALGEAPYLLFLGRLNEIKGPDILLEAFAAVAERFPDINLMLAGPDGGMLSALQARVTALGLSARVKFSGFLGGDAKVAALRGAHLLVIPSRREAMSIVVLEAGACARPVLFTDACGLGALAASGAGVQVQADVRGLAEGLEALLYDLPRLTELSRLLAAQVEQHYLWRHQAASLGELCAAVMASDRR